MDLHVHLQLQRALHRDRRAQHAQNLSRFQHLQVEADQVLEDPERVDHRLVPQPLHAGVRASVYEEHDIHADFQGRGDERVQVPHSQRLLQPPELRALQDEERSAGQYGQVRDPERKHQDIRRGSESAHFKKDVLC